MDIDFQIASAGSRRTAMRGLGDAEVQLDAAFEASRSFKPPVTPARGQFSSKFSVLGKPLEIFGLLYDMLFKLDPNVSISKSSWRLTFTNAMQSPPEEPDDEDDEENTA